MKRTVVFMVILAAVLSVTVFETPLMAQQDVPQPAVAMQSTQSPGFEAAMNLYRQRRYAEAIQAFDTVLQSDPNNAAAHYFKGYAQYVTRQYSESVSSFGLAFQADPTFDPRPYFHRR